MRKQTTWTTGLVAACLLCSACYHYVPTPEPLPAKLQKAGEALDKLTWYVNAYGGASITTPLLVLPDDAFKFNLDATQINANTFFNAAKNEITGRSAGTVETTQSAGVSFQGSPEPTPPTLPSPAAAGSFAAPQTLFATGTPAVSGDTRNALLMAAGDNATNAILSLLGDPGKMSKYKRVLFGVSMVSVNPGWKTSQGYSVDVSAYVHYKPVFARPSVRDKFLAMKGGSAVDQAALQQLQSCVVTSLPLRARQSFLDKWEPPPPPFDGAQFDHYVYTPSSDGLDNLTVAAVSPMSDGQALDLQSATRRQSELALQMAFALSYAGLNAQAAAFESFAKRRQNDIETRTNNVVVNAYAHPGGNFGFHILPRLAADPADGGSSVTLGHSSFPTLIIIGTDDDDLRPRVLVQAGSGGAPQCFVVERQLQVYETSRWVPLSEPCVRHAPSSRACVGEMLTELERYQITREVDRALPDDTRDPIVKDMVRRYLILLNSLNGASRDIYLPADSLIPPASTPPSPNANVIAPTQIEVEYDAAGKVKPRPVTLLIAGSDLDKIDLATIKPFGAVEWIKAEKEGSPTQTTPNARMVGNAIQLVFQVESEDPVWFQLTLKNSSTSILSRPLIVRPKQRIIQRQDEKGTDTLSFSPTISDDVMKSEIEKKKKHFPNQSADVKVRVNAEAGEPHKKK